jgi:hypothetical protein
MKLMKIYLILGVFTLAFFLMLYITPYIKKTTYENYVNKSWENVLIFSAGPSLNELEYLKKYLTKEFLDNTYVICVKSAINEVYKQGIKVDCFVTNFEGSFKDIQADIVDSTNANIVCVEYPKHTSEGTHLDKKCNTILNFSFKNNKRENCMQCIIDDEDKCLELKYKNGKLYTKWGHTILEAAIPMAVKVRPKNIYILGWDMNNTDKRHYTDIKKESFTNKNITDWADFGNIIYFTKYLPDYLKKHYNINIYKLSNTQKIQIPYINLKNI